MGPVPTRRLWRDDELSLYRPQDGAWPGSRGVGDAASPHREPGKIVAAARRGHLGGSWRRVTPLHALEGRSMGRGRSHDPPNRGVWDGRPGSQTEAPPLVYA